MNETDDLMEDCIKISKEIATLLDKEFLKILINYEKNNDEFKNLAEIALPIISEMFYIGQIGRTREYYKHNGISNEKANTFIELAKKSINVSLDRLKEFKIND